MRAVSGSVWRWLVVVLGVAVLVATPGVIARLPVGSAVDSPAAADLLARVQASVDTPYSGYAESTGGVVLPITDQLGSLPDLLGDTTTMRTWFRGPEDWRVDTIRLGGERDLYRHAGELWRWDYEQNTAVLTPGGEPRLRLPREQDVLPTTLGHRLLSEARPAEVSSVPARRIAGRDAPGLRLVPTEPRTTISTVDVWVDPGSALPLRVDVRGAGSTRPTISTAFLDFSAERPDEALTTFTPPPGAQVQVQDGTDVASFADRLDTAVQPGELAGLPAAERGLGSVGVYGRGVTTLVAVPLPARAGRSLDDQLTRAPGAVTDDDGVALAVGPLSLRVTRSGPDARRYLLAGTVDADTLSAAAQALRTGAR